MADSVLIPTARAIHIRHIPRRNRPAAGETRPTHSAPQQHVGSIEWPAGMLPPTRRGSRIPAVPRPIHARLPSAHRITDRQLPQ